MRTTLALGAVLALVATGCMSRMPPPRTYSFKPVELKGFDGVPDAMGRLVVLEGTAYNARSGPVVVGNGLAVHCQGMDAWPERMVGRKVTISGLLDHARDEDQAARGVGGSGEGPTSFEYVLKHPKLE